MDTIRIGHMIGPPFLKLSIKKFEAPPPAVAGASLAAGLSVAVTVAAGDVATPGGGTAGPAGGDPPSCAGAAGFTAAGAPGLAAAGAPELAAGESPGGAVCGGAGDCAREVSVSASEHRYAISSVFIVEAGIR